MKESAIEQYLVKRVRALGGEIRKVKWIGRTGAPDRLILWPLSASMAHAPRLYCHRGVVWVELKSCRGILSPAQIREHARLRACGQRVVVLPSKLGVDQFLD